jgi:citronellol/citronellal dehydrogenase
LRGGWLPKRPISAGDSVVTRSRTPEIMAEAAHLVLTRESRGTTGQFFIDETVLRDAGITDFERYAVTPGAPLNPDIFLD